MLLIYLLINLFILAVKQIIYIYIFLFYHLGSCVPQNISIFNLCTSYAVRLHWTEPIGAVLYKSSVTSSLGEIYTCKTTNNSCDFSGLQCGETYSATVTVFNIQQANVSLGVKTFQTGIFFYVILYIHDPKS